MLTSTQALSLPELVQFRMIVDASANLMAAIRRTDAQLRALERSIARMRAAMEPPPDGAARVEFSRADLEFHEIIAEAGGNQLIQVYGEVIREAVLRLIERTISAAEGPASADAPLDRSPTRRCWPRSRPGTARGPPGWPGRASTPTTPSTWSRSTGRSWPAWSWSVAAGSAGDRSRRRAPGQLEHLPHGDRRAPSG